MEIVKISLNITDKEAFVSLDYKDGTTKNWDEKLTPEDFAAIVSAGILMQKGAAIDCVLANTDKTNKKIAKLEKLCIKARMLLYEIMGIKKTT